MKLNCDMGESFGPWLMGRDDAVMPWINMANIACGFHASDPDVMAKTVACAGQYGVEIGAHPGYNDKEGFGRRSIPHSAESITQLVAYQAGALNAICQLHGQQISYVKPHGALYNDMMTDESIFIAILTAVAGMNSGFVPPIKLMVLSRPDNQNYQRIADQYKVVLLFEAFSDRAYTPEGFLVPRSQPEAVYHSSDRIVQQAQEFTQGYVTTSDGSMLKLRADSLCVHGDNDASIALIQTLHEVIKP
ncbi:5-oxoprolinase subunit PxpA [Photobacterium sanguinicancri]|uniref:5-oxoprolinase subunit PxpA n=1 Tax=Photobacterium sanguinicancri TaxID=875932 RepID=UPI0026E47907|nr:5-oxoprolinase subunit PxpA [Photobacterium sanguinicancri]MDO6498536.1 5-oxoprolinase subunit PxpA [Photobacterium sanguinicancri]